MVRIITFEDLFAAEAEQVAGGKEKFDWSIFIRCYSHETGNCKILTEADKESLFWKYAFQYYQQDQIMTIAEFGDFLDRQDAGADF